MRVKSSACSGERAEGTWLRLAVLALALAGIYYEAVFALVEVWMGRNDYSHGFLVPLISLSFVWTDRARLRSIPAKPALVGGFALALIAGALLVAGKAGSAMILEEVSLLVMVPALVLLFLGAAHLRALLLPICYLVLMVPFLDFISPRIHWPLQIISAKLASRMLELLNIPVLLTGQFIELPNISLEVAQECSGFNYIFSVVALGIPLGYYALRLTWQRLLLIAFGIFIAMLGNSLRITLIGVWAFFGGKVVHGPFHIFKGFFVSIIGDIALFAGAWVLSRLDKARGDGGEAKIPPAGFSVDWKRFNRIWIAFLALVAVIFAYRVLHNPVPVAPRAALEYFPNALGEWNGSAGEAPFGIDGADHKVERTYTGPEGGRVSLFIGYFEDQSKDRKLVHYSLSELYKNKGAYEVYGPEGPFFATSSVLERDHRKYLILYWFDLNGRNTGDIFRAKLIGAADGILNAKTNGAIVILATEWEGDGSKPLARAGGFANALLKDIGRFVP